MGAVVIAKALSDYPIYPVAVILELPFSLFAITPESKGRRS